MTASDPDERGIVVVSVDAELGWGFHDLPEPPAERVEAARTGWIRLLGLLDEYDVPATWAVVGHLFLDDCDGEHADHPTPDGWFERERGDWAGRRDLRFADGLLERVDAASAGHEVGAHSFSHALFGRRETTPEVARAELAATRAAADRPLDSFVFPRNSVAHRDALADAGYTCYRGLSPEPAPERPVERVRKLARLAARTTPPVVRPVVDEHGLVNVPASQFLFDFEGGARAVCETLADDPVVARARRGVDAAARSGGVYHAWLHPNNVRNDRHARRLRRVLGHVAARRDEGAVRVEPMGAVADRALDAA
ncbi:polysaccharide deacetylase family protein [Halobacterium yunchengense]|uniref:polysaccharide deacetylase family protein n=1 Tax=Halobacterium yunchengense TaxID=3108497 RepID=UPI003008F821